MRIMIRLFALAVLPIVLLTSCTQPAGMITDPVEEYPLLQEAHDDKQNGSLSDYVLSSSSNLSFDSQDVAITAHMNMLAYFDWSGGLEEIDKMPGSYGGCYINDRNALTVCIVSPNEDTVDLFEKACVEPIVIREVAYSLGEMYRGMEVLSQFISEGKLELYSYGVDEKNNNIPITMPNKEAADAAELLLADYPYIAIDYVTATLTLSKYGDKPTDNDVTIEPEFPVYDPSIKQVVFTLHNNGTKNLMFGADFNIDVWLDGAWYSIPLKPNTAFVALGYTLAAGKHAYKGATLTLCNYVFTSGKYRLVQTFDDKVYFGEFELGESSVTPDSPHGFAPLDDLPTKYTVEMAKADGCIIEGDEETYGRIEKFLDLAGYYRRDSMIRIVSDSSFGGVTITDITFNTKYYSIVRDSSRTWFGSKQRTEKIFSFVNYIEHRDTFEILLTNYTSVRELGKKYDSESVLKIKDMGLSKNIVDFCIALEDWYHTRNASRYVLFSEDGTNDAALSDDPKEFAVGSSGKGQVFVLPPDLVDEITDIKWISNNRLQLIGTVDGTPNTNIAVFNTDLWDYE